MNNICWYQKLKFHSGFAFQKLLTCRSHTSVDWIYKTKVMCNWSFLHSYFLCRNLSVVCADYLIVFQDLWRIFPCYFFQKQASKDHLTQGTLLKATLNENKNNLEKEMYGNISLHYQYFSPGAGCNVHKTYLLKLTKNILSSLIKKAQKKLYIYINIYICNTHNRLKHKSPKFKTFLFTLPKKQH